MHHTLIILYVQVMFHYHNASQIVHFVDDLVSDNGSNGHIVRVMKRMGFVPKEATNEMVIYKARELNPEFPGIIDLWQRKLVISSKTILQRSHWHHRYQGNAWRHWA
jgi:hypothetical protein